MNVHLRRKSYAVTFLLSGVVLGGIGLLALWAPDIISGTTFKIILTLLVTFAASATLYMLSFGAEEDKVASKMTLLIGACTVGVAGLLIGQIWFDFLDGSLLGKAIATLTVVGFLAGFVISVWDDFFENKRLKDENYLD